MDEGLQSLSSSSLLEIRTCVLEESMNLVDERLKLFGSDLKILLGQINIISGWIKSTFGYDLINKNSSLYKNLVEHDDDGGIDMIEILNNLSNFSTKTNNNKSTTTATCGRDPIFEEEESSVHNVNDGDDGNAEQYNVDYQEDVDDTDDTHFLQNLVIIQSSEGEQEEEDGATDLLVMAPSSSSSAKRFLKIKPRVPPTSSSATSLKISNKQKQSNFNLKSRNNHFHTKSASTSSTSFRSSKLQDHERHLPSTSKKQHQQRHQQQQSSSNIFSSSNNSMPIPFLTAEGAIINRSQSQSSSTTTTFTCTHCSKSFDKERNLLRHSRIHTGETIVFCSHCHRQFSSALALRTHLPIHSSDRVKLTCSYCSRSYYYRGELNRHIRTMHPEQNVKFGRFKCKECGNTFLRKCNLERHAKHHAVVY